MSRTFLSYLTLTALGIGSVLTGLRANDEQPEVKPEVKKGSTTHGKPEVPTRPLVVRADQPCPEKWRFTGEFLYFLPTLDDTYFVFDSSNSAFFPNGERTNNDFGFKPGFRVGAEMASCKHKREFLAFYSYLNADQSTEVAGAHLWATNGIAALAEDFDNFSGTASSNLQLMYQDANLNISQDLLESHGANVLIQAGVEYAYLRLQENIAYQDAIFTSGITQKSKIWSVGPQLAFGVDYNFYQGAFSHTSTQAISFTGLFSGALLMGHAKTDNFQTLSGITRLSVHDEHTWRVIPAVHMRLGLNYLIRNHRHWGLDFGAGYEFNSFVRAYSKTSFPSDVATGLCTTNYYNFDLQGLYVSGAISF